MKDLLSALDILGTKPKGPSIEIIEMAPMKRKKKKVEEVEEDEDDEVSYDGFPPQLMALLNAKAKRNK